MAAPPAIIHTSDLFRELDAALIAMLKTLGRDEWRAPTIVPRWNVQQVAAHLLDTACRRLSARRDDWRASPAAPQSERELVELINEMNADGVRVYGSLSPELLITFTEVVTPQLASHLESLDPMGRAPFAVSWAGETTSPNWFDIAREFTERWHHQAQIRLATNRPGIMTPRLYRPVLETFMRALPRTYRDVEAADGTACDVVIPGECGGHWRVTREQGAWSLSAVVDGVGVASTCVIPADLAWRLFTKGASRQEILARVETRGDERLGSVIFGALAIVG
jgi:uncharacterized protein (TIGR03083 family)